MIIKNKKQQIVKDSRKKNDLVLSYIKDYFLIFLFSKNKYLHWRYKLVDETAKLITGKLVLSLSINL